MEDNLIKTKIAIYLEIIKRCEEGMRKVRAMCNHKKYTVSEDESFAVCDICGTRLSKLATGEKVVYESD